MFKAGFSRDNGEPWPPTGMTTAIWMTLPTQWVTISELIAMQEGVYFHALLDGHNHGPDPFPHVVQWHGELYLEDGHSRAVKALLRGLTRIEARFLNLDDTP